MRRRGQVSIRVAVAPVTFAFKVCAVTSGALGLIDGVAVFDGLGIGVRQEASRGLSSER
jgi:hypothetical protein